MSHRLHWCYNDYMTMPITQLLYWATKTSSVVRAEQVELENINKKLNNKRQR